MPRRKKSHKKRCVNRGDTRNNFMSIISGRKKTNKKHEQKTEAHTNPLKTFPPFLHNGNIETPFIYLHPTKKTYFEILCRKAKKKTSGTPPNEGVHPPYLSYYALRRRAFKIAL